MTMEFTPAGTWDGIPLHAHECAKFGVAYVSEAPSAPGDPHVVPMCGCHLKGGES